MTLAINTIDFDELTSDPGSPAEGQVWYNTTLNRFSIQRDGSVRRFADLAELQAHIADTTNPHSVTLEQARSAGDTLAGPVNMGGNAITNVADPSNPQDAATQQFVQDQIRSKIAGQDWQNSVLDRDLSTPPGGPVEGDRYIVGPSPTGAWTGQENAIAEWNGSAWEFATPNEGFATRAEDENAFLIYDGTSWGVFAAVTDHGALTGLGDDDHTQYVRVDGTRAFSGDVDLGGNAITNVGNVDGVDVSAHASRHEQGAADELDGDRLAIDFSPASGYTPDASPAEVSSTNQLTAHLQGIATQLVAAGAALSAKAGRVSAGSFALSSGTLRATVAFASAFGATPSVRVTAEASGNRRFAPNVLSVTTSGFTIDLGTAVGTDLVAVNWSALEVGESA